MSDLVKYDRDTGRGVERFVDGAPGSVPKFSDKIGRHHKRFYDDYEVAKAHIRQAIGIKDDWKFEGLELFGRRVCVAVFIRPNMEMTAAGVPWFTPVKDQHEDMWQQKCVLIVKCGPEAFQGDQSWLDSMYGVDVRPPAVGDWVFANASAGTQISLYDDEEGSRPQGVDYLKRPVDLFEWEGWPCRIINDTDIFGRLARPNQVV